MHMKTVDIRELTTDEIRKRLEDAREEMMRLRFRQATGELTDTSQIRITRRTIARFVTVLDQRARAAEEMEGEE
jgi:large subunit ribosomal protein L29